MRVKLIILMCILCPQLVWASDIVSQTQGKIVLAVEDHGEAWYINPADQQRYYLGRPDDAWHIMKYLGTGITTANLALIPTTEQAWDGQHDLMERVRGKILLQVEDHGEAWYVNPSDGKRYYLGRPDDAWHIMTEFGLGIRTSDLETIKIGDTNHPTTSPNTVLLNVPFTTQAPTGNWSSPFGEACEEASLIMLDEYTEQKNLSASDTEQLIRAVTDWEMDHYGHHEDTSATETAQTARDYFELDATVSYDVNATTLKHHLRQGHLILAPVYGKALQNVHYTNGGPYYHMILIVGYDEDDFIAHDPGTRFGKNYHYNSDVLISAIHDLTNPETNIASGTPAVIIIKP